MRIQIINGPNLNMLGKREPKHYGSQTLAEINQNLAETARSLDVELEFFQSNHEGELVEAIQQAGECCQGIILNAGAYTHTSVAVRDAVLSCGVPVVEVHLSNPQARESFRQVSLLAGACAGAVSGFGAASYELALRWFASAS